MLTVKEVSELTKISIRTLHYYDSIGLLHPTSFTEAGYRLYSDADLERLQLIMLYKELGFTLKEINEILNSSDFDKQKVIEHQIKLLKLKKERLEHLITFAQGVHFRGVDQLDFSAFDTSKIDDYRMQTKTLWGKSKVYKEYEDKTNPLSEQEKHTIDEGLMVIFAQFGEMKNDDLHDESVHNQVKKLQNYISEHYYTCTDEMLIGLGHMYASGGSFTENIDKVGGAGTAQFVKQAILHCIY